MGSVKRIIFIVLTTLFFLAVGVSVGTITYFVILGKGINVDKSSHSTSTSNSYANSGSLSIGYIGGDYRGNWEIVEFRAKSDNLGDLLKSLDPIQFLAAKVVEVDEDEYLVCFPKIVSTTVEDHKSKKVVNGVEVK